MKRDDAVRERRSAPPTESRLSSLYAGADLADAYAISLSAGATRDAELLARALFSQPSTWFRALLALRDVLVAPFGIKTSGGIRATQGAASERIDFFPILERSASELILGEDDRHLDFRASILVRQSSEGTAPELVVTTIVHCHNLLGRTYLLLILPFHAVIIRTNLRRAARRGWPPA